MPIPQTLIGVATQYARRMRLPQPSVALIASIAISLTIGCGSRSELQLGGSASGGTGGGSGAPACDAPRPESKLVAASGSANEEFGFSVSLFGEEALVGAWKERAGGDARGAAYVYGMDLQGKWVQRARLGPEGTQDFVRFGVSVSLGEHRALVGAFEDDGQGYNSGAAYIFRELVSPGWTRIQKLQASGGSELDEFGVSVSLYEERALIGARGDDNALGENAGAAYIFERQQNGKWSQVDKLTANDGGPSDWFGAVVSLWGDTAVIARSASSGGVGAVYVFERAAGGNWTQTAKLSGSSAGGDRFGKSVSLHLDRALVGAPGDSPSGTASGSAIVFERSGAGAWSRVGKLVASDASAGDLFGESVSLSGDRALVGAVSDEDQGEGTGAAYLFAKGPSGQWIQVTKLLNPAAAGGDLFGESVSLSGDRALVGAPLDDDRGNDSGSATVVGCLADDD